ncbi:TrkA C-terminal domain-containing protein [Natrarchaeobius oligotrophus]|uniref:Potassium transporter TrkA n=1 Tax=Natrarchaeobius chitinivorans TaxID=1679083 RepID=A0A3N6LX37_NATCH|nr:TrkA C-terminal domain-containing protein [Natrarchaeobius chitinivorans]RQG95293.1 potassium transporter TrkA [Natrarchaeobius chitinivorans]
MNSTGFLLTNPVIAAVFRIVGVALLAGAVTTIATFVYRVRVRNTLPDGATLILGLGVVAIYLNTRLVFIQYAGETGDPLSVSEALINVTVFVVAGIAAYGGRHIGDTLGTSDRLSWGWLQPDLSPIVRATGRFITVTFPDEIDDIDGYDPVADDSKTALKGRTMDFPRGLTISELQSEITARLRAEHDIGYVDLEITADGTVEYLAVGQRPAGIGPTLPPKSAAVAIRADPPFSASPGDTLQLWYNGDDGEKHLGTAELRSSAGQITTVVTDEATANRIDPTVEYRLMTLSADSSPDREFAAILRRGDETMSVIEIGTESPLVGVSASALDVTILSIRSPGGDIETMPDRERLIQPGDNVFAIGRPNTLRKLEVSNDVQLVESDTDVKTAVENALEWDRGDELPAKPIEGDRPAEGNATNNGGDLP